MSNTTSALLLVAVAAMMVAMINAVPVWVQVDLPESVLSDQQLQSLNSNGAMQKRNFDRITGSWFPMSRKRSAPFDNGSGSHESYVVVGAVPHIVV